ncbi:sulfite exporter TauE/SafE family protein [uncultured Pedobacter sp.]|uniref:sulfite exporter TauE/SafE family protein n=1 Tax=uncultured Pedobacter sp. TaxID=246139 RepID=UPI0025FBFA2B|nr:sulfite exporter TauE/SafE family protein [uncultured Pedobacter sp.]
MQVAGYIASIFIGISLGLIGGGGSILTVPVLVYLFGVDAALATNYSLFIVGATSVTGSFSYFKKRLVNTKMAAVFGIPSIISVFLTRAYIMPVIPGQIFSTGSFILTKNIFLMLIFAVLMVLASYSMIKKDEQAGGDKPKKQQFNYPLVFSTGILVGIITGFIGAGGGFLIIPVLSNLLKLPMKAAVGTSLLIISTNSLVGFVFSLAHTAVHWHFLLTITFMAIAGILIGSFLSAKIEGKKLRPAFGWFVLVMGIYIIIKETLLK